MRLRLYGVADVAELDLVYTYEADSPEEAAAAYLDDPECVGTMVRVWPLARFPFAFVKTKTAGVVKVSGPTEVAK